MERTGIEAGEVMKKLIPLLMLLFALQNGTGYRIHGNPEILFHTIQTVDGDAIYVVFVPEDGDRITFNAEYLLGIKYIPDSKVM
jgi:hypothetical protein